MSAASSQYILLADASAAGLVLGDAGDRSAAMQCQQLWRRSPLNTARAQPISKLLYLSFSLWRPVEGCRLLILWGVKACHCPLTRALLSPYIPSLDLPSRLYRIRPLKWSARAVSFPAIDLGQSPSQLCLWCRKSCGKVLILKSVFS